MTPEEIAAVLAAHAVSHRCNGQWVNASDEGCEPYRLAVTADRLRKQVAEQAAALARVEALVDLYDLGGWTVNNPHDVADGFRAALAGGQP